MILKRRKALSKERDLNRPGMLLRRPPSVEKPDRYILVYSKSKENECFFCPCKGGKHPCRKDTTVGKACLCWAHDCGQTARDASPLPICQAGRQAAARVEHGKNEGIARSSAL